MLGIPPPWDLWPGKIQAHEDVAMNFPAMIQDGPGQQEVKRQDKAGKNRHLHLDR
jgi:hypothetical protein